MIVRRVEELVGNEVLARTLDRKVVEVFLNFTAVYPVGTQVLTSEGEIGIVVGQNKDFQDRPILRIIQDKDGGNIKKRLSRTW